MKTYKILAIFAGAILFNSIFWMENLGLNILIYTFYIVFIILLFFRKTNLSKGAWITIGSLGFLALAIVYHSSTLTKFTYFLTIPLLIGFLHQNTLKSVLYAFETFFSDILQMPVTFVKELNFNENISNKLLKVFKFIRLAIIPLCFLIVFFWIFSVANLKFGEYSDFIFSSIYDWFSIIFAKISFARILFFLLGFTIISAIILVSPISAYAKEEMLKSEFIKRIRNPKRNKRIYNMPVSFLKIGLKNEYKSAIILLVAVNILLLIVNSLDIKWVWFDFRHTPTFNLKQFVHEGTYLLIFSILLSMGIMLYFFRKNLNFFPQNTFLKQLSYLWIFQNAILTISVAIRNLHYINYFGLAYKRIGVFLFLILVLYGLWSLYKKISQRRSAYFLFRTNGWCWYIVFVAFSLIDWDSVIAKHNLDHRLKDNMETSFLLTMSDKILPLIDTHKYILEQSKDFNTYQYFTEPYTEVYQNRLREFDLKIKNRTWLSWNYAEYKAYLYFCETKK